MKEEHMNICREMTLVHYKPNEIIVKQGDPGDSFFIILSGMAKITITKYVDIGLNGNKIMTEV
jgi:CRP-like cAMP-binding protein